MQGLGTFDATEPAVDGEECVCVAYEQGCKILRKSKELVAVKSLRGNSVDRGSRELFS